MKRLITHTLLTLHISIFFSHVGYAESEPTAIEIEINSYSKQTIDSKDAELREKLRALGDPPTGDDRSLNIGASIVGITSGMIGASIVAIYLRDEELSFVDKAPQLTGGLLLMAAGGVINKIATDRLTYHARREAIINKGKRYNLDLINDPPRARSKWTNQDFAKLSFLLAGLTGLASAKIIYDRANSDQDDDLSKGEILTLSTLVFSPLLAGIYFSLLPGESPEGESNSYWLTPSLGEDRYGLHFTLTF